MTSKTTMPPPPKGGNNAPPGAAKPAMIRTPSRSKRGSVIVINGVEGSGKTSLAAYADDSLIVCDPRERGYETLYNYGRVPERPFMVPSTWNELLATLSWLATDEAPKFHVLGLDALSGFESLCHQHVCTTEYDGEWGERGFTSYHRGYEAAIRHWKAFLQRVDRIRDIKGCTVLLLSHCQIKNFKNPAGPDFDRYVADAHAKTWDATRRWADAVLFYNWFELTQEDKKTKRVKGSTASSQRVLYTERADAWDAKNRHGLPTIIEIPDDPAEAWRKVRAAFARPKQANGNG